MYIKGTRVAKESVKSVDFHRALKAASCVLMMNPERFPFGIEKLEASVVDLGLKDVYDRVLAHEEEVRSQERKKILANMKEGEILPKWATGARPFLGRDAAFRKHVVVLTLCRALAEKKGRWGSPDGIGTEFLVRVLGDRIWESLS